MAKREDGASVDALVPRLALRDDARMTDDEVIDQARAEGFELIERISGDQWVQGWARDGDELGPCFLTEREALSWMSDRLQRSREESELLGEAISWLGAEPGVPDAAASPRFEG